MFFFVQFRKQNKTKWPDCSFFSLSRSSGPFQRSAFEICSFWLYLFTRFIKKMESVLYCCCRKCHYCCCCCCFIFIFLFSFHSFYARSYLTAFNANICMLRDFRIKFNGIWTAIKSGESRKLNMQAYGNLCF